ATLETAHSFLYYPLSCNCRFRQSLNFAFLRNFKMAGLPDSSKPSLVPAVPLLPHCPLLLLLPPLPFPLLFLLGCPPLAPWPRLQLPRESCVHFLRVHIPKSAYVRAPTVPCHHRLQIRCPFFAQLPK